MYTPQQFLDAAKEAEVSLIDAQHIIDVMVKMNEPKLKYRIMLQHDSPFKVGEIVKLVGTELDSYYPYLVERKDGFIQWIKADTSEPTTETF